MVMVLLPLELLSGKNTRDFSVMTIISKALIILLLVSIFFSLGSALYYLITEKGNSTRIVKALTWRIALSMVLFILILIAFAFGWLTPHPI